MDNCYAPRIASLKVNALKVDPTYQRTEKINKRVISKIVKEYDPHLLGVLIVSKRNGDYYVIDGQHRLEALKNLGIETVYCMVVEGLVRRDEALKFIRYNSTRAALTQMSIYKSELAAGDEIAMKIHQIAYKHGYEIGSGTKYKRHAGGNRINAIGKLKSIYSQCSAEDYERMFTLLRSTWNGDTASLDCRMLGGIAFLIRKCGPLFSNTDFIEKMWRILPSEIVRVGKAYKGTNADSDKAYAMAILQFYNSGKTTKRVPETLLMDG